MGGGSDGRLFEVDPRVASAPRRTPAKRSADADGDGAAGRIVQLQAAIGNAAVARLLRTGDSPSVQRDAADGAVAESPAATILRYGDRGDEVRELQRKLNLANGGRRPIAVDGIFGRGTQAAVRAFQQAHPPLAVDGDAGPETLPALEEAARAGARDAAVSGAYQKGREAYTSGDYAHAYDAFSKAFEAEPDPAYLWNRAQSLRLLGGRRMEAIALYEQFLASDADADELRSRARQYIDELRGPGRSGDNAVDTAMAYSLHRNGRELYLNGNYAQAYDEFTKAWEIGHDPALLWNRAQSLRLLGGRRAETIALYEALLVADIPEDKKVAARLELVELRGPGRSADEAANTKAVDDLNAKGRGHYLAEEYAQAYDDFSKAWEVTHDPALLWNRAQSLRLLGGRREEALALYRQILTLDLSEDAKKAARAFIDDLAGPAGDAAAPAGTGTSAPVGGAGGR